MNALGHKKHNLKSIGHKSYYLNHIGNKMYDKSSKVPDLKNSTDGLIENYSNHPNQIYEPIKGVQLKTSKSKFLLEKPQKAKSKSSSFQ